MHEPTAVGAHFPFAWQVTIFGVSSSDWLEHLYVIIAPAKNGGELGGKVTAAPKGA